MASRGQVVTLFRSVFHSLAFTTSWPFVTQRLKPDFSCLGRFSLGFSLPFGFPIFLEPIYDAASRDYRHTSFPCFVLWRLLHCLMVSEKCGLFSFSSKQSITALMVSEGFELTYLGLKASTPITTS